MNPRVLGVIALKLVCDVCGVWLKYLQLKDYQLDLGCIKLSQLLRQTFLRLSTQCADLVILGLRRPASKDRLHHYRPLLFVH